MSTPRGSAAGRWSAGLLAFGWLELIYRDHDNPVTLASLALAYFALMLLGMALFGIEAWTERGDAFGGYFNLFSRLALFEVRDGVLCVRRPLERVSADLEIERGTVALVLTVIGITTFDGASNGVVWNTLAPHIQSVFSGLGLGADAGRRARGQHRAAARARRRQQLLRARDPRHASVSRRFPYSQLLRASPIRWCRSASPTCSPTTSRCWSGRARRSATLHRTRSGATPTIRHRALAHQLQLHRLHRRSGTCRSLALVLGHVSGLALAHDRALSVYRSKLDAVRSQYWMLAVMVTFTCLGLWLLSDVNT